MLYDINIDMNLNSAHPQSPYKTKINYNELKLSIYTIYNTLGTK